MGAIVPSSCSRTPTRCSRRAGCSGSSPLDTCTTARIRSVSSRWPSPPRRGRGKTGGSGLGDVQFPTDLLELFRFFAETLGYGGAVVGQALRLRVLADFLR